MSRNLRELPAGLIRRFPLIRSLRTWLILFALLIGIVPSFVMRAAILRGYEQRVVAVRTSEVSTQLRVLANHLINYDYLSEPDNEIVNAELVQFSSLYDGRILIIDSDLRVVKDTYDMSEGKIVISEDVVSCLRRGSAGASSNYVKEDNYIDVIVPIAASPALESTEYTFRQIPQEEVVRGVILASISTDSIVTTLDILGRRATLIQIILVLVIFAVTLLVILLLFRPFDRLTSAISEVRAGYSTDLIRVRGYQETDHLIDAFNQVLGRMRSLDASRQEFVSNVSHELKTPMTSMKVLADSLLQQEEVPAEMYREFLQDIDNEIDRENKIIAELLSLSKMDRRQVSMNITSVNIAELLEVVLKRVRPIAKRRGIELILVVERDVVAEVDEVKLTMALTNLIDNAVKYNKENGTVTVKLDATPNDFVLTVEDTGIGIPEESLERIYERFYRVDQSRSREIGGTGLGLSITKSAILLHRGQIDVESKEGEGTSFRVRIPLSYAPPATARPKEKTKSASPWHRKTESLLVLLISLISAAVLSGCGLTGVAPASSSQNEGAAYRVYYVNKDDTTIVPTDYRTGTTESLKLSQELLDQMETATVEVGYFIPISGFEILGTALSNGLLTISLSEEYRSLEPTHEILVRAAIVNTLCQVNGVTEVQFLISEEPLMNADGTPVGPMTDKMFIFNSGNEIEGYERVRLHLYFANEAGDRLIDTYRSIVYNSNISMERLVTEQVLRGPISANVYPTLNAETKIISVTTRDGVCYVNLDNRFLSNPSRVTPQVAIYSLVNSLTELPTVSKVQISVDGSTTREFMETMDLSLVYSRSDAVIYQGEE